MRVLLSGATGFIGEPLMVRLSSLGINVIPLSRQRLDVSHVAWDPEKKQIDLSEHAPFDAVIHLAGASIAEKRWTKARKKVLWESRVDATRFLAQAMLDSTNPPKHFIGASAIGYYGDRGDEELNEASSKGAGFLADLTEAWESAADPFRQARVRVCHLRIGVVLDPSGGALNQMLPIFWLGVGGRLGSGKQWMSWISRADVVEAFCFLLRHEDASGAFNGVAPAAVTNAEFTAALGRALKRPTWFPVPSFALRLALGEMADEALLASSRVVPSRLADSGFEFRHRTIDDAFASFFSHAK